MYCFFHKMCIMRYINRWMEENVMWVCKKCNSTNSDGAQQCLRCGELRGSAALEKEAEERAKRTRFAPRQPKSARVFSILGIINVVVCGIAGVVGFFCGEFLFGLLVLGLAAIYGAVSWFSCYVIAEVLTNHDTIAGAQVYIANHMKVDD